MMTKKRRNPFALTRRQRWRRRAAHVIDRYTGLCWAALVSWYLYGDYKFFDGNEDFSPQSCIRDSIEEGSCYCGKYKDGRLARKEDTPGEAVAQGKQ